MRNPSLFYAYQWLYKQKDLLELKFFRRQWSLPFNHLLPSHYCCSYITFEDITSFGLSTNNDPLVAQAISAIEAYERAVMHSLNIKNSNGCAIHTSGSESIKNARNELLERDAYMRLHYTGSSAEPFKIDSGSLEYKIIKELDLLGIKVDISIIGSTQYGIATMVTAEGLKAKKPFGLIIGLGFEDTLAESIRKSFFEALRLIDGTFKNDGLLVPIGFKSFIEKDKAGVHEHIGLGMDIEYGSFLKKMYLNPKGKKVKLLETPKFSIESAKADIANIGDSPLFFSRVTSTELIPAVFGNRHEHEFLERFVDDKNIIKYENEVAFHILG